jgi:arylsulfatase A-like enzyme
MGRQSIRGLVVALATASWSCATLTGCQKSPLQESVDLVAELPAAEVQRERSEIDLGTAAARPHLGIGWSLDERLANGTTMVWAVGRRSEVVFFLSRPMRLSLEFMCRPYRYPGSPTQRAKVSLNGGRPTTVELVRGLNSYEVMFDASEAVGGVNTVAFEWAHAASPSRVRGARDRRPLAARFDRIRFAGPGDPTPPSVDLETGSLVVPCGSEIGYYVRESGSAVLELGRIDGPVQSRLEVWSKADGAPARLLCATGPTRGARAVHVPLTGSGPVRLSLRGVGESGVVSVAGPRIALGGALVEPNHHTQVAPEGRRPNILLYLVDTLRADHLGCYGHAGGLSPCLDRFARDGVVFRRAIAQSPWTKPSVVSIFTGLGPVRHGVNDRRSILGDEATTMAELLARVGYQTAGFACNGYITERAGFAQGFEDFLFRHARSEEMTNEVIGWLERRDTGRPFFLYVHTVDPHAPYDPPPPYRSIHATGVKDPATGTVDHIRAIAAGTIDAGPETIADLLSLYGAEVAENDASFGRLLGSLRHHGVLGDTLVVFVSDHGEGFQEHGVLGHGWDLYGEVLTVPMVVSPPGGILGRSFDGVVRHVDLLPTILEFAGVGMPSDLDGISLRSEIVTTGSRRPPQAAVSYIAYEGREGIAVELDGWKMIEPLSANFLAGRALFDTRTDPGELSDRAGDLPVRSGFLASLARRELSRRPDASGQELLELDGETERALQALGYIR